jgi:hypothetical protein
LRLEVVTMLHHISVKNREEKNGFAQRRKGAKKNMQRASSIQ